MEAVETMETLKAVNTTPHLNRSKVKQTALELAATLRPANHFRRASAKAIVPLIT